ncbi:nitrous oxide reductase accessory protein NosL, partial [Rhodoferax sp. UBA5149]|uniref:nitrous oxide reductase accessory protein NosL n=1 Tax=Rhodoferax sp. UBA5149 TaxID=1947379 RepID=UPI0025FE6C8C
GLHAPRPVPADARCPVCGMYPARSLEWAAQVVFDNGDTQFFDSPLTLFIYLQDVGRYTRGRQASEIAARYVSDASSGAWINAVDAVYVSGSAAVGPMRAGNLPAFADAAAAQRFASARGGLLLA